MHTRQLQQYTQDNYNSTHKTNTTIHTTTTIRTRQLQQCTQDNYNNTYKKTNNNTHKTTNNNTHKTTTTIHTRQLTTIHTRQLTTIHTRQLKIKTPRWLHECASILRYTNIACLAGLEEVMPHIFHAFLFSPLIFPQTLVVRRAASHAPRNLAASYLLTYVRCATFGPTCKTVILINCQIYGRVFR